MMQSSGYGSNVGGRPAMPSTLSLPGGFRTESSSMRTSAGAYGDYRFPTTSGGLGDYSSMNAGLTSGNFSSSQFGSSPNFAGLGMGGGGGGGTQPSIGAYDKAGLPTTVAFDKAAAALNPQAPMAIAGIDTNHDGNANLYYLGADRNRDGIPDALQTTQAASGGSYMLTTEGNPFSSLEQKSVPMKEEYMERAINGDGKLRESLQVNGLSGGMSSFDYGALTPQPPGSLAIGELADPFSYSMRPTSKEPSSALHDGTPQPFLQTRNLAEEVTTGSKYNGTAAGAGDFNFPKTGSFVAAPYDSEGLPYYDKPSKSYPSAYEGSRSYTNAYDGPRSSMQASRGMYYDTPSTVPSGAYEDPRMRRGTASSMLPTNGYDSYFQDGMLEYRNGAQEIGSSYLYGQPPGGRMSYERIGSPMPGSPMPGNRPVSTLAASGSFVASPFAEGAPTLDFLPPVKSSSSYAPPPAGFSTLAPSGSFVASPFAVGAPTPDMLGMSLFPRNQGSYPETYASLPPAPLYGMGSSFGGNNRYASPFVGYDSEVPGAGAFGANSLLNKGSLLEGGRGSSLYGSRPDYPQPDRVQDRPTKGEQNGLEDVDADPNSKQSMSRSRDREGAPRIKRKGERRACC